MVTRALREPSGPGRVEVGFRKAGAVLLIAIGAATLSACAENEVSPTPTVTAPVETPTATPEAPSPELAAMYAETADAFIARPLSERTELCNAEADEGVLEAIGDLYAENSGNDYDKMPAVSIDNTPQEILSILSNVGRLAYRQQDPELATKLYSCAYVDPATSERFQEVRENIQQGDSIGYGIGGYAQQGLLKTPTVTSHGEPIDGVDTTTNERTRSIVIGSVLNETGTRVSEGTYTFVPGSLIGWAAETNN
jgi:hypothetical protein